MKQRRPSNAKSSGKTQPSIFDVVSKFGSEQACITHLERIRWPEGPRCPRCGGDRISKFEAKGKTGKDRYLYECMPCSYQYSVTVGTIFHDSHLSLTKWFLAIYLICSNKKGISAKELQRQLSVTYKTAWYMAHRIRLAMQEDKDFCQKFSGVVESDETYVGGKQKGLRGRAVSTNKVPVVAIKERTSGKIRMQALQDVSATSLSDFIRKHVGPGAELHTDEFGSYLWLDTSEFAHEAVNHGETYVRYRIDAEPVHTNGCENVWSLFKRGVVGVFHKVSAKYLPLYLNEFEFRFNNRDEFNMMDRVLETCF
jgi:transposase-like protein